jgi:hypothetical protein
MTRPLTLAGYGLIVAAAVVYEMVARRRRTATLGDALAVVTRHRVGTGVLVAGWLWVGWHLFARVSD